MSKYIVLDSYPAAPGNCVSCGSVRTPAIDTGVSVDYYGAVYFCHLCAQEIGRAAGLVDKPEDIESPVAEEEDPDEIIYDILKYIRDDISSVLDGLSYSGKVAGEPEVTDFESKPALGQASSSPVNKKSAGVSGSTSDELGFGLSV